MFGVISDINWLGVLAPLIVVSVFGGVLFGVSLTKQYADVLGLTPGKKAKVPPIAYIGPTICNLAANVTSAILLQALQLVQPSYGAVLGLILGVGYLVAMMFSHTIPLFPRWNYDGMVKTYFVISSLIAIFILVKI